MLGVIYTTRDPSWGHPRCGLGAVGAVLEPFCGHLSPKIDKVSCTLTFEIHSRRTLGGDQCAENMAAWEDTTSVRGRQYRRDIGGSAGGSTGGI